LFHGCALATKFTPTCTAYAPNDTSGIHPTDAYTIASMPNSIQISLPAKVLLIKIAGGK
jgi:hypothetical protein